MSGAVYVSANVPVSACANINAAGPGECPGCGAALVEQDVGRRYCSVACRKAVAKLELEERNRRRRETPADRWVGCGSPVMGDWRCPNRRRRRNPGLSRMRRDAGGPVRFNSDAWEWLAGKLGVDPGDEGYPPWR